MVKAKKRNNPLRRRLLRELKSEFGKYLVIFLLITATIGLISGFLVTDNSVAYTYREGFTKYNIEDGHFRTEKALNRARRKDAENFGITLYDNYYIEAGVDNAVTTGTKLRIYENRSQVDLVCVMEGRLPDKDGELALDRMFAENNHFSVGDTLISGERSWTITGLVALADYSCLYETNSDSMFDSVIFGVAVVAEEEFSTFGKDEIYYNYSWIFEQEPEDEAEAKQMSDDLLEYLNSILSLQDYLPEYCNNAITFTGEDMSSDKGMIIVLLYIMIAVMAFVFAVTISNTITKEANVIGTLRAMGYSRGELIRHYMTMPVLITLIAILVGNILGYTVFIQAVVAVYYGSYSLATYETLWNAEAFLETSIVPLLLMIVINWTVLARKLKLSPQQFLRRDLSHKKNGRALPLPAKLPFMHRFRTRVIFQNISNYLVLALGILLANMLLLWGLGLPDMLNNYEEQVTGNMFCKYQYILTMPVSMTSGDSKLEELISGLTYLNGVETENEDAEKFMAYSLKTTESDSYKTDDVTIYGIEEDSRYLNPDVSGDNVVISSALADKYWKEVGDEISLKEPYENTVYTFAITGIYEYDGGLAVFMNREHLNEILGYDKDLFAGYFSDSEITDIDEEYLGTIIDENSMTKVSRQLDKSFGGIMIYVNYFAVIIFVVLMYLLSKIIIEKNAQAISMAKIMGYNLREIAGIYITPTTLVVLVLLAATMPLEFILIKWMFHFMMLYEMTGWIPVILNNQVYLEMFAIGALSYAAVVILEMVKIRRIHMDEALKNVE